MNPFKIKITLVEESGAPNRDGFCCEYKKRENVLFGASRKEAIYATN